MERVVLKRLNFSSTLLKSTEQDRVVAELSHIITRFYPVSTRPRTPQIENKKAEYMSNILLQPG